MKQKIKVTDMNPIKILKPNEFTALLRGLNFWTLKQKIKDHTTQRVSTVQLLYKIDLYEGLSERERAYIQTISDPKEQQDWIKSHGKLTKTTGFMKSHSFTLQYLQIMFEYVCARVYTAANNNGICVTASIRDTSNTLRQMPALLTNVAAYNPALNAVTADVTYGILCGTGATAPATADYKMQTLIAQGSGAGQFQYQATAVGAAGIVGANVDCIVARVVVNGSSGTITITEVGMQLYLNAWFFLIAHDAVSQAVNAGAVAVISYDLRTTV
jgi:hypothetical protein